MPIYEYACSKCGKVSDVLQKMSDPAPEKCEHCGAEGTLTRVVSRTTFVLKGGGWYSDLYGSSKKDGKDGSGGTKDSAAKDSGAKDAPKKEAPAKDSSSTSTSTSTSASGSAASTTTSSAPKTKAANE